MIETLNGYLKKSHKKSWKKIGEIHKKINRIILIELTVKYVWPFQKTLKKSLKEKPGGYPVGETG